METFNIENVSIVSRRLKYSMDPKERILTEADGLFKRRGVRGVTMDDIARELGMSKKTLYQYFGNKADIVFAVTETHFECEQRICEEIMVKAKDPVEEFILILQAFVSNMKEIPSSMVFAIQRYYPKAWKLFDTYKSGFITEAIHRNLIDGVEKGLYRKDMDIEVVTRLRIESMEIAFNPEIFPPKEFDLTKVEIEHFKLFLHGIVTIKGKKLIYQYLNQPEDE